MSPRFSAPAPPDGMAELRTFIFTDIVRSVALKSEMEGRDDTQRDRAFIETILTPHRERIEAELAERGGRIVSTAGDGHFLVFSDTIQAAQWAIEVQQRHEEGPIATPSGKAVEVRISLHVGVPQIDPRDPNNFVGKPVDYAARLNDFARGGQILCSRAVAAIIEDVALEGISLHSHGPRLLRGIGRVEVYELVYREAGPMETLYHPIKHDIRQWTIIPPGPAGLTGAYPAPAPPGAGSAQATVLHPPYPRRLGNYELEELLGSGGMGDVYKARHTLFDRTRAVKVIKQGLVDAGRTDVVRRFYQEIKAVGKLEHKNIVVAVESSAPQDPVHYLVMEYIEGISLDDIVAQHGPLTVADACEAIRQAARGLAYIHKHGMVHRDIKPSNLMLTLVERSDTYRANDSDMGTASEEVPLIKILDLGLALLVDEHHDRLTQLGQRAMGTGMYMSPEQWRTSTVDIRADIYSLGCTLYHLLAGRPPFLDSDLKPEKAHEKSKIPPIVGPTQVPRKLWEVIRKMLAKNPEGRYESPAEVVAALAPFSEGHQLVELAHTYLDQPETDTARVGTTAVSRPHIETLPIDSKASRPPRWRRPRVLGVACLVVLLLATAALGVWYWRDRYVLDNRALAERASGVLVTLPGLNGLWWFEETPWLTPHERALLFAGLQESEWDELRELATHADVQEIYAALERLTASTNDEHAKRLSGLVGRDASVATVAAKVLGGYDPLLRSVEKEKAEKELEPLLNAIAAIAPGDRSPTTWHLLGVLEIHLQEFAPAEAALKRAESGYNKVAQMAAGTTADVAEALSALVAGDLANLDFSRSDFAAARLHYGMALERMNSQSATPHHVYTLGMRSQAGIYDRQAQLADLENDLDDADRFLELLALAPNHPLRAFVHERRAHLALETWQLSEAIRQAELAGRQREVFANLGPHWTSESAASESRAPVSGNHHAQQGWFRAQQIVALALHFQGSLATGGDLSENRTEAWVLFNRLERLLSRSERVELTVEQARVWQQLKPNFRGRKADAELFTMGRFALAAESFDSGIRVARDQLHWEDNPERQHFLAFMLYKRAIALHLAGPAYAQRAAEVRAQADELDEDIDDPNQERRFEAFKQVATQLAIPGETRYLELADTLRTQARALEGRIRDRDNRQLLLFVAAYLREVLAGGLIPDEWITSEQFPPDAELQAIIAGLLKPLKRDEKDTAGDNYLERIQESALEAARPLLQRGDEL